MSCEQACRHVDQVIGYDGVQDWSSRSPNLTPLFFFQWGYLKHQVCVTPPQTSHSLKDALRTLVPKVSCSMLQHAQRDIQRRIQVCIAAEGEKFEFLK
ncbi:uncharacterized protein TNCV_230051 [Trichonephila clavipes]|nr:uncharacterized protein TNCV_230051 [Trichonephila clavipes]